MKVKDQEGEDEMKNTTERENIDRYIETYGSSAGCTFQVGGSTTTELGCRSYSIQVHTYKTWMNGSDSRDSNLTFAAISLDSRGPCFHAEL